MIVNGQERLDGLAVSKWAVRFTGTHDLEIEDAERLALDKVVLFLCATRAGKFEVQVLDDGEVKRKNVATVSDFMVLTGEMRERAISALANGTEQGLLQPPVYDGNDATQAAITEIDRLAAFLIEAFDGKGVGPLDESAVDMAIRLLDDPRVMGVLQGTLATVETDTGELHEPEPSAPTAVGGDDPQLEQLSPHELETDPGWTPADDVDSGWDPRDLPETAPEPEADAEVDGKAEANQNPDPESEAARAAEPAPEPAPESEVAAPESEEEEPAGPPQGQVVGHVNDRSGIKDAPRGGREGPGVGKFDPATFDSAPEGPARRGGPERVGIGAQHHDPILKKFMDQDVSR